MRERMVFCMMMGVASFSLAQEAPSTPGVYQVVYDASTDGEPLGATLLLPTGFNFGQGERPLLCFLHGGGQQGNILQTAASGAIINQLNARGWIGVAPDGRAWGLSGSCENTNSFAYIPSPDPRVGNGEQDTLDLIDWAAAHYPVDASRIYLAGFSFGGRGTYIIGLNNPDRFAAIGPIAPSIDMYEIYVRQLIAECIPILYGGPPDNPVVNTRYKQSSARFMIENAYNLPIFQGHGLYDTKANNDPNFAPFLNGWHITTDTSWSGCMLNDISNPKVPGTNHFCFGHTPTLSELKAHHPAGYDWARMFAPVEHAVSTAYMNGVSATTPTYVGVPDPASPANYESMIDFFADRTLVTNPDTVVFKTYDDIHRKSYWLQLDIDSAWTDTAGAARATRDSVNNTMSIETVHAATVTINCDLAQIDARQLVVSAQPLVDSVYDPALRDNATLQSLTLVFQGAQISGSLTAARDGNVLDASLVQTSAGQVRVGPISLPGATTIAIAPDAATAQSRSLTPPSFPLTGTTGVVAPDNVTRQPVGCGAGCGPGASLASLVTFAPLIGLKKRWRGRARRRDTI